MAIAALVPCPKCKQPLSDPHGMGWCKACGYCQSADPEVKRAQQQPKPTAAGAFADAFGSIPAWAWIALGNIVMLCVAAYCVNKYVALTPLQRALWTTIQTGGGLLLILAANLIGLFMIAPEEATLTLFDAFVPFRLYELMVKRLPRTRVAIYLATWGVALIVSANLFIGGMAHWTTYLPGKKSSTSARR